MPVFGNSGGGSGNAGQLIPLRLYRKPMPRFVSFSARTIAIAYVAVSLAVLAIFAGPLWYTWDVNIGQVRTDLLRADARRLQKLYMRNGVEALAAGIDAQVGGIEEGVGRLMLLVDPAGHRLGGNLRAWPGGVPDSADGQARAATIHVGGQSRRVELINMKLPGGYRLLIASNLNRFVKLESLFIYGLLGCATVVLIVGVLGGLLIRRTLLSRVDSISLTTAAIVEGQLSKRLPAPQSGDELEMLTHTVNGMLDQIQKLVHGVQDVSNAIAHDLRTPLSELRARLEELSVNRPGPAETFAEIDAAIADVDLVMAIFNALLRLADIDSGTRRGGFVVVDLAEMASEVAEFYLPVA
jgi:signal transduction histidine kinase